MSALRIFCRVSQEKWGLERQSQAVKEGKGSVIRLGSTLQGFPHQSQGDSSH